MGLIFPECFKATPVSSNPHNKFKDQRTSSLSSSKTLVDFESIEKDGVFVEKKIYQTLHNQYIVTSFMRAEDYNEYEEEDTTDTEEYNFSPTPKYYTEPSATFGSQVQTIFACANCHNHICISNLIMSENFHGRSGDLNLVSSVINCTFGIKESKSMMTGTYDVCDVNCKQCGDYLGWKYLHTDNRREKYKVGKVVIEKLYFEELRVLNE